MNGEAEGTAECRRQEHQAAAAKLDARSITTQQPRPERRKAVQAVSPIPISTTPCPGALPIVPSGR
jgi:hypothetical protein